MTRRALSRPLVMRWGRSASESKVIWSASSAISKPEGRKPERGEEPSNSGDGLGQANVLRRLRRGVPERVRPCWTTFLSGLYRLHLSRNGGNDGEAIECGRQHRRGGT